MTRDFTFTFHFHALEKEMGTHSSIHSCLENPMDRGDWGATVHGIAKSQTRLINVHSLKLTQAQSDSSLC